MCWEGTQSAPMADTRDENIEMWKTKRLIKALEAAKGNGTSMISLIIPPRDQISRVTKMLADEFGTANNIKSRVNRQSVLAAITCALQRLKLYSRVPRNGLILYTGTIVTEEGKEKKVTFNFEPFKPINVSLYLCDNKFHTDPLCDLIQSGDKFGFIVMDGNGSLFGTLSGNTREVLYKFSVDLMNGHRRGGQSAKRLSNLRDGNRHDFVKKTAELARQYFIDPSTCEPNVARIVLAGAADFKSKLNQSNVFDHRLQEIVLSVVDVKDGGEKGFNQAIDLSSEMLAGVKFTQEKKLLGCYYDEINHDTSKYVSGLEDTLKALEIGAVKDLIVSENLDVTRYEMKDSVTGDVVVRYLNKDDDKKEVKEEMPLLEWLADNYQKFGCAMKFVSDKSEEGAVFCRGYGGIGGILRYPLDMRAFDECSDGEEGDYEAAAAA